MFRWYLSRRASPDHLEALSLRPVPQLQRLLLSGVTARFVRHVAPMDVTIGCCVVQGCGDGDAARVIVLVVLPYTTSFQRVALFEPGVVAVGASGAELSSLARLWPKQRGDRAGPPDLSLQYLVIGAPGRMSTARDVQRASLFAWSSCIACGGSPTHPKDGRLKLSLAVVGPRMRLIDLGSTMVPTFLVDSPDFLGSPGPKIYDAHHVVKYRSVSSSFVSLLLSSLSSFQCAFTSALTMSRCIRPVDGPAGKSLDGQGSEEAGALS